MASTAFCQVTSVPSTFVTFGVGAYLIVADALFPYYSSQLAGGHGGGVISTKPPIYTLTVLLPVTGYVARGIAGKDAASSVESHRTADIDIIYGGYF